MYGYIFNREPGGQILEVDVPNDELDKYDAQKLPETKYMDIERDNYILPKKIIETSNIVKLDIESKLSNKFLFSEMKKIRDFVDNLVRKS